MAYKFKSMEKLVGIFIVAAILTLISFIIMIGRGKSLFIKKNFYYTYFNSGEGINKGVNVVFNGIKIGSVVEVKLNPDNRIYVKFFVIREYADRIKKDSVAKFSKPLLGSGVIKITKGFINSKVLPDNSYIISSDTKIGKLLLEKQKAPPSGVDKIAKNLEDLTYMLKDPEGALSMTLLNLQRLTENLNKITENIAENDDRIDDIIISLQETMDNLVEVSKNLKHNRLLGGKPQKKDNKLITK